MIIPSTRLFTAGEVETAAYFNSTVTNLGNFILGKPVCQLYSTAATAITGNTDVPVPFANEFVDRDNGHSTTVNNSYYTAQTAGYYYVSYFAGWAALATSYRLSWIRINGTTANNMLSSQQAGTSQAVITCSGAGLVYLAVGDYLELCVKSGVTTALATFGNAPVYTAALHLAWVSV
jgi:hypothetical protein